ncbi:MAG: Fe-S-cluster containining protein [Cocleimonas sp.]|jgi:Fe-S-cluster containining protein
MITQEAFNKLSQIFTLKYLSAKKNITTIHKLNSTLNEPIEEEIKNAGGSDCKSGCSHCCIIRVEAFPHEIISLYLFLNKSLDKTQLEATKKRINEQYIKIKDISIDEHFRTNIQCPLLVDNRCSAYEARPLACAGYHSMSVERCIKSFNNPTVVSSDSDIGIPMIRSVQEEQTVQNTVATFVIENAGDDKNKYELISGLYHVFKNPNWIQKWKKGKKFIS